MPSRAFSKFENKMLLDVDRLIESHTALSHDGRGRHSLGHITRSGVFLLCAAWELYIEELAEEIAATLAHRALAPNDLPLGAQKELSKMVRAHKNDLKPLELAGGGWEGVYVSHVREEFSRLNTPKAGPIDELYKRTLGWSEPSSCWSCGPDFINEFVKARGDIAHRGSDANYVRITALRDTYRVTIADTAIEHDNAAADFIYENADGNRPWR
ncbi:MAG: HEPN domain-containing protein [Pikeienuella sp.]